MVITSTVADTIANISELRGAIRHQRTSNNKTYLQLIELQNVLQSSDLPLDPNEIVRRNKIVDKFESTVVTFSDYLKKYNSMHRISRILKLSNMGKERQEIVDEIDQIFQMLNVVSWITTTDGPASENEDAARFLIKLKNLKLSHDEIQAELRFLMENSEASQQKRKMKQILKKRMTAKESMLLQHGADGNVSMTWKSDLKQGAALNVVKTPRAGTQSQNSANDMAQKMHLESRQNVANDVFDEDLAHCRAVLRQYAAPLDGNSIPQLVQILKSDQVSTQQTEKILLLLISACATNGNRVQVFKSGGLTALKHLGRIGASFYTQIYALHCLSWFTFSYSMIEESEFEVLRDCIREVTPTEILSLFQELQHGDPKAKEAVVIRCSCLATRGDGNALRSVGVIPLLINLITKGTVNEKLWATETLVTLSSESDESCIAITRAGAIPPLVTLLRSGNDMQKQEAAYALGSLAANSKENCSQIAHEGAIPPLVAFMKAVTDVQNQWAVYALGFLSLDHETNRILIGQEGAIAPLVAMLQNGTSPHKQWAAYTLQNLAINDTNRVAIKLEGAIAPLVALLQMGTEMQKLRAAYAIGKLACIEDEVDVAVELDEAIALLVEIVRAGSDPLKKAAAYTLGKLAATNDDNNYEIVYDKAVAPLVELLQVGTENQKQWSAYALGCLAKNDNRSCAAIVQHGAVDQLNNLVATGTKKQKVHATRALKHLVRYNDTNSCHSDSPQVRYYITP